MPSHNSIQVLSDDTIRKIAAGEVVERPYSIVKELMENAVDAFATTIEVSIEDGGMDLITVIDNGIGFTSQDLPLSVVKNATSKIKTNEDLISISTNGFRGEALSSISSVSKFEIITKHKNEGQGFHLASEGGKSPSIKPSASQDGTMVIVRDLFFNVPARKKFLKSKSTEYSHIEKGFKKIALAHPEIHFVLKRDGKVTLNLPKVSSFHDRIGQLYPSSVAENLVSFESENGPISLFGFGSNTSSNLSRPSEIWIFVNGRWIHDRALIKAVCEGYRSALMEHKYPYAFVYIQMPPSMFDINVHPTKSEIRFQDPQMLFRLIQRAIAQHLQQSVANHRVVFHPKTYSFAPTVQEMHKVTSSDSQQTVMASSSAPTHATEETKIDAPQGYFSSLSYLSVLDGTYILCKNDKELVLIDQHAAHERVLYTKLKSQWENNHTVAQRSLIPHTISLNPAQFDALESIAKELHRIGIEFEKFGEQDILVRSMPSFLDAAKIEIFFLELLEQVQNDEMPSTANDIIDHLLSTTACHSAVRAHDRLEVSEIFNLLTQLDQIDHASYCPHGRPSFVKMDLNDLEKIFKRKV